MSSVLWLSQVGLNDRPSVGGKGANLGELVRAGIAVPPGFVVPVSAFEAFLKTAGVGEEIRRSIAGLGNDLEAMTKRCADIRARIKSLPLPASLEDALAAAYGELCKSKRNVPVAVRSSATAEDSEEASFAGLQDTYLWLRGERAVIDHVRACWASLYSIESVDYRLRLKLPEDRIAMAVVVQVMAHARASGVMFTRSPTTGDRSTIAIEGAWGLGSAIVSGEVTPDRFIVSKVTGEITQRTISHKALRHVPEMEAGSVREEEVPDELKSASCLSDAEIGELAATAKRVEKHYGRAQDIEWAVAEEPNGKMIYLLQSRPETVWSSRETKPIATPKARAMDHILAALGGKTR